MTSLCMLSGGRDQRRWRLPGFLISLICISACTDREGSTNEKENLRPIAWTSVSRVGDTGERVFPAVLQASDRAVLSFEIGGRVESVAVDVGDQIKSGETLAILDDRTIRLTLAQRQAELKSARATLTEVETDYKRQEELIESGAISQSRFDATTAQRAAARSQVDLLEASVDIAKENLDDTRLVAPYAGIITRRFVEPAQLVDVGTPVVAVQKNNALEAQLTVPEDWITRLELGGRHRVMIPVFPELSIEGKIVEIGADALENNAFPVTLIIDATLASLRSGMSAEVILSDTSSKRQDTIAIPITAFLSDVDEQHFAFVIDEKDSRLERRTVTLGEVFGDRVVITSGLDVGEKIATKGLAYLYEGQAVELLDTGTTRFLK